MQYKNACTILNVQFEMLIVINFGKRNVTKYAWLYSCIAKISAKINTNWIVCAILHKPALDSNIKYILIHANRSNCESIIKWRKKSEIKSNKLQDFIVQIEIDGFIIQNQMPTELRI